MKAIVSVFVNGVSSVEGRLINEENGFITLAIKKPRSSKEYLKAFDMKNLVGISRGEEVIELMLANQQIPLLEGFEVQDVAIDREEGTLVLNHEDGEDTYSLCGITYEIFPVEEEEEEVVTKKAGKKGADKKEKAAGKKGGKKAADEEEVVEKKASKKAGKKGGKKAPDPVDDGDDDDDDDF